MIDVSVIIPVYKNAKLLDKCLESLNSQSFKNQEIITVDDNKPHQGPAMARNRGAKSAAGKILVFVDSDMIFDKNFIKNLTAPIISLHTKGTFSKEEYVANWDNIWARCWNYNLGFADKLRIPGNYPDQSPVFRAILKSEFLKVGGFDPTGYDDDWTLAGKLGYYATQVWGAKYFHFNPDNLLRVFSQAKWRAKRRYKLGLLGDLYALIKYFFPISLVNSLRLSWKFRQPALIIFKIIFDFGSFMGILEKIIFKNYY